MGSRAQAQYLWRTGLVVPRHVGSLRTRDQTCLPCIGRWILNHCATREVPIPFLFFENKFILIPPIQIQHYKVRIHLPLVHICISLLPQYNSGPQYQLYLSICCILQYTKNNYYTSNTTTSYQLNKVQDFFAVVFMLRLIQQSYGQTFLKLIGL